MSTIRATRAAAQIRPDPRRVLARLFLPGEEPHEHRSRVGEIVHRILDLDEAEVERAMARLTAEFSVRHPDYLELLGAHAAVVTPHFPEGGDLSEQRRLLVGASFTAEYSVEGAAVCNPSAVLHPDQSDLAPGQARVAMSVRGIGEGHVSSVGFREAVVGPGPVWRFADAVYPVTAGVVGPTGWERAHLGAVLRDHVDLDELGHSLLGALPEEFGEADLDGVLAALPPGLLSRPAGLATTQLVRRLIASSYRVAFADTTTVAQRVLMPAAPEESNGIEDARFTRFVDDDGAVGYRATYTAYDGRHIVPRLLTSDDLREFTSTRLAGPAARNKGMALFPRTVGGSHLALCRSDGETTGVTSSPDGVVWSAPRAVHAPDRLWEALQVGNCGPPIETEAGWLVLTHGVGPMRVYVMGALLLDLDDPTVVLGSLAEPLLAPTADEQDGYVPNVVYSCGALLHDGVLWIPYGIGDARIGVARVGLDELLTGLTSGQAVPASTPA